MLETLEKLRYRANAGISEAKEMLYARMTDRLELPLAGIHGEKIFLTDYSQLNKKTEEIKILYEKVPNRRGVQEFILLDSYASATIEGARTTVAQVRKSIDNPKTKDDKMVINAIKASQYAFDHQIKEKNIRKLWEIVTDGVCENAEYQGKLYRDGMVYIGSADRYVHVPAEPTQLPDLMHGLFEFQSNDVVDPLLRSFISHFYFAYIHPFCDGNGRTARILNVSRLYQDGFKKMKSLPLANAINNQLSGYYSSMLASENVMKDEGQVWLDISPFVSYMLDAFERCLIDASLSNNKLSDPETKLLERMNKVGLHAEITVQKAMQILDRSESGARSVLKGLVEKGYLTVDMSTTPFIYKLEQHI